MLARLRERLLPVRSVWFPSRRELRAWDQSGKPLYYRRIGERRFEVGPRLASMWASCFSPVLEGRLEAGGVVRWKRRLPRFTLAIVAMWWTAVTLWMASLAPALARGDQHPAILIWWTLLALASTVGPWLGRVMGGRELDEALPWLREALEQPDVGEDW